MRAANSHFGKHYINGVWTTPKGAMIDVENPATREIFARVPDGTPEEVDAAVAAAQSAFPRWSSTPLAQRIALMEGMLRRFCEKTEAVIELEVAELGAPGGLYNDPLTGLKLSPVGVEIVMLSAFLEADADDLDHSSSLCEVRR